MNVAKHGINVQETSNPKHSGKRSASTGASCYALHYLQSEKLNY